MLTVPDNVYSALVNHNRCILFSMRLEIDGVMTEIKDCMTVDEDSTVSGTSSATDEQPFGIVTCNTASFVFDNLNKKYTMDNKDSIYYKKLIAGAKVILNYKIMLPDKTWFVFPDLIYYTSSWKSSTSDNTATLTCFDTLSLYKDLEVPAFPLQRNITVYDTYKLLFNLMNVPTNMYKIDETLTDRIKYFWKSGKSFQEQLCNLAKSSLTNVFATGDGIIHVVSVVKKQSSVLTINDSDLIISTSATPTYYDAYSACTMKYKKVQSMDQTMIYQNNELTLQPGVTNLTNLQFTTSPVASVIAATVTGGKSVTVLSVDCTSENMNITLSNNTTLTQKVVLQAYGIVLKTEDSTLTVGSPVKSASTDVLEMDIPYILSVEMVNLYAKKIINNYNGSYTNMDIEVRGMPILQLYDKITVSSASSKILKEFRIRKIESSFDTGLNGTLVVSVPADTISNKYMFVGPGMITGI